MRAQHGSQVYVPVCVIRMLVLVGAQNFPEATLNSSVVVIVIGQVKIIGKVYLLDQIPVSGSQTILIDAKY